MKYQNGNATIEIQSNGTRIIECHEDKLKLKYPLNIDIRVSSKCSFGLNPATGKSVCSFCHESAKTNGTEFDYAALLEKLSPLPAGIELAIGSNELTSGLIEFLQGAKLKGFVCNVTVNQGHLKRDFAKIQECIKSDYINGLGISYRPGFANIPKEFVEYSNTVVHCITGIDSFTEVSNLSKLGVKKILILGEKDFGFNLGKVNIKSKSHLEWFHNIRKLFDLFDVVSFDNLALEQLRVSRFIESTEWRTIYQGEHSFYINAVEGYFSPSSRSFERTSWETADPVSYFQKVINL